MVIYTCVIIIDILVSVTSVPSNIQTGTVGGWSVLAYFITHDVRGNRQTNGSS